jgi:hypothetical protein
MSIVLRNLIIAIATFSVQDNRNNADAMRMTDEVHLQTYLEKLLLVTLRNSTLNIKFTLESLTYILALG